MDGVLFISTEEGLNNGATAAWVGLWLTSWGTLESLKDRAPPHPKRQRRKEGISRPEGVRPAASSRV